MTVNSVVASALQQAVVDLNALAIHGKQLHWNIQGESFQSLHEMLDTIVEQVRNAYDDFAERLVAIGGSPDARPATIAERTMLKPLEEGYYTTERAYEVMEEELTQVAESMIKAIESVDSVDHLSGDLFIGTARDLQKSAWMLRAALGRLG